MSAGYTTLVVSDHKTDVVEIKSKLNISRNMDAVYNCNLDRAVEFCRKYFPDIVIIFAHEKNGKLFEVCKIIRLDSLLKHIPIIFIYDKFDEEFILESLNSGVNDYIVGPIRKMDILAHISWAFTKSGLTKNLEVKEALLKDLEIIDREIGAYLPKYIPAGFGVHIGMAKKYKYPITFMAIHIDAPYNSKFNTDYLAKVLKRTARSSDVIGLAEQGKFYLLLPKTDLKATYAVHSRITKNLGDNFTISVGICFSPEETTYEILSNLGLKALSEAISNGGNRVFVYSAEQIAADFKGNIEKQQEFETNEDLADFGTRKNWINKVQTRKKSYDSFKKEFIKKINDIISPGFYKMRDNLKIKYPTLVIVDYSISDTRCEFSVKEVYEGTENILEILDIGLSYLKIERNLIKNGKQTITRYSLDIKDLTETYIERILQDLYNEFEIVSDLERISKEANDLEKL